MEFKIFFVVFLIALGQQGFAKNLDFYRLQVDTEKTAGQSAIEVKKLVTILRAKLGTSGSDIDPRLVQFDLAPISAPSRISYNTFFKNLLQGSLARLSQDEKYQSPTSIDDTSSMEKLLFKKENVKRAQCIQGFLGSGQNKKSIDSFLGEFLGSMRESKNKRPAVVSEKTLQNFLALLRNEIEKLGFVEKQLGPVVGVQVTDGKIKEILIKVKDIENPLQLTLSMLLTARTGEDTNYISAQQCLLDFLQEQSAVLQTRLRLLDNNIDADKMELFRKKFEKIAKNIEEFEGKEKSDKWKADRMFKDPRVQYLMKLPVFMEGRTFLNNDSQQKAEEKSYILSRLDLVHGVLELMKPKFQASKKINMLLSKMNVAQVNRLIDLFLQLRGNDILTEYDYSSVTGLMFKISSNLAGNGPIDLDSNTAAIDHINYTVQHRQLFQLVTTLDEEKMLRDQKQKDADQIVSGRP